MELVTVFRLSLYGLTALTSWMLGRAEGGWIPYVTLPVLILAYVVTESRIGFSLPPLAANLCGMLAVAASAFEFFSENREGRLLSGAHLLVYATWIVMLQQKTLRNYWWLMALGVLQVAVASVLTSESWYGFTLIVYICCALWTMSVASLYQAQQQFASAALLSGEGEAPAAVLAFAAPPVWNEVLPAAHATVQHDGQDRWITRRFGGGLVLLAALSLAVSALFFIFTPRMWFGARNIFESEPTEGLSNRRSLTGFARQVRLGELGQILESVEPVLEIRCFDVQSKQPVPLEKLTDRLGQTEPLFRGAVMTEYAKGAWTPEHTDPVVRMSQYHNRPGFRQDIRLEPTSADVLFCLGTPVACEIGPGRGREDGYLHQFTGLLSRETPTDADHPINYSVYVAPPPIDLAQLHATLVSREIWLQYYETGYLRRCEQLPSGELLRLRELAEQLVADAARQAERPLSDLEKAQVLERHLRDSGQFGYTLDLSIVDRRLDPVEDFLFNRRVGHCEYFATSLTLMLRAVGLPARLVSGYKGAERNELRGAWEVQQRHAHAWVEVWISPNLWVTLDPTPATEREQSVAEVSARVGFWGRMRSTTANLWTDYVVNVSLRQQQEVVYGPLRELVRKVWLLAQDRFSWGADLWRRAVQFLQDPAEWVSFTGGRVAVALLCAGLLLFFAGRRLIRNLRSGEMWTWWKRRRQQRSVILFYERFLDAVRRVGHNRAPQETPREFAETVASALQRVLAEAGLAALPETVCTAFYRVRYGGEFLSEEEVQQLGAGLQRLETLLSPAGKTSPTS